MSTRAYAERGENVLIGGFIITGDAPKKVLIRAIGPSLEKAGVANAMKEPVIHLHDGAGSLIKVGHNSRRSSDHLDFPTTDPREPVMVAKLEPGNYTVVLSGRQNTTGVALLEELAQ